MENFRPEKEVFLDLELLCRSPGYAHVIAYFCFRDNLIKYEENITPKEIADQYSSQSLIRTEITTLIGLMVKGEMDLSIPSTEKFENYIERTEALLNEMHHSLMAPFHESIKKLNDKIESVNPFTSGNCLREPIFYGGESAYNFQYLNFSVIKYQKDDQWLKSNKGFTIEQAKNVIEGINKYLANKAMDVLISMKNKNPSDFTVLPLFTFHIDDIVAFVDIDYKVVDAILKAFALPKGDTNENFLALNDFNCITAHPIIKTDTNEYLLLQSYALAEALYEAPFYWFLRDRDYINIAMENRGEFTENFSEERLKNIFGEERVYKNIFIVDKNNNRSGEIDVLVVFSNRAIIIQAKSKRLTINARKGNDECIKNDFKKSIQDSYKQGLSCSKLLNNNNYTLQDKNGQILNFHINFKEIYIFCIVSDHYPALSFQARHFLNYETTDQIMPPFIMDIFYLDIMAEFLNTPLYFLSYVNRRTQYSERIHSMNEITILSYHLKKNLWLDDEYSFTVFDDSIATDLDLAFMVRREGWPGKDTPNGILTDFKGTNVDRIIQQVEYQEHEGSVDFGFFLLEMSGDGLNDLNKGVEKLTELSRKDHDNHDLTMVFSDQKSGLTIHCNYAPPQIAGPNLHNHCEKRKYFHRADKWFGICIDPSDMSLKMGIELNYEWSHSDRMDAATKSMIQPPKRDDFLKQLQTPTKQISKKIGRNAPCPCGSGKKYKKCCLNLKDGR